MARTTPQLSRLSRWWRHRRLDPSDTARVLPAAALDRLQAKVAASERVHTGEIRVIVEAALPLSYLRKGLSARDRAITLFGKQRVWDTEHNNGVLIYLLLADRAIEFVADRALARKVSPSRWQSMVDALAEQLRAGAFENGLAQAIDGVDALLREHFPLALDETRTNELPDRPLMG